MGLQEAVEVMPDFGDPVDDFHKFHVAHPPTDLRLHELPPQEAAKETLHRLRVVGTKHPPGGVKECLSTTRTPNMAWQAPKPKCVGMEGEHHRISDILDRGLHGGQ